MKIVVFGAGGQIGHEVCRAAWPRGHTILPLDRKAVDISKSAAVGAMLTRETPDLAINLAAYTAVDRAESEPDRAWAVNCAGAAHIAAACGDNATPLIHLSTDYVFDGRKTEPYREDDRGRPARCLWTQQGGRRARGAGGSGATRDPTHGLGVRSAWGEFRQDDAAARRRTVGAARRCGPTRMPNRRSRYRRRADGDRRAHRKRRGEVGHLSFCRRQRRQLAPLRRNDLRSRGAATRGPSEGRTYHHRPIPDAGAASDELGSRLPEDPRSLWDLSRHGRSGSPASSGRCSTRRPRSNPM